MTITRTDSSVEVSIFANGMTWRFSHARSTPSDAANLETLIKQQCENEARWQTGCLEKRDAEIDRLKRANAALRGHLRRAKGGAA